MELKNFVALKVNDTTLNLDQLLTRLKLSGQIQAILQEQTSALILEETARKEGIKATPAEIAEATKDLYAQMEVDDEKEAAGELETVGLTPDDIRRHAESQVLSHKLRERLTKDKVNGFFKEHWEEFETADISEIVVMDSSLASELATQLKDEGAAFEDLANKHSIIEESRENGGYVGAQVRAHMPKEVVEPVFSATPGSILGPLKVDKKYFILRVEGIEKAQLNEETFETIEDHLMDEWLDAQIQKARVSLDLLKA